MQLNPYKLVAQIVAAGVAVAMVLSLFMSWSARGQQIAALQRQLGTIVQATTYATVEPDAKGMRKTLDPDVVPAAIAGLKRSFDSCQVASVQRTRETDEAKQRADNADKALAAFQTVLQGEYSSAQARIKALEQVKAQPTPQLQCQSVGVDSKAAWEGWK